MTASVFRAWLHLPLRLKATQLAIILQLDTKWQTRGAQH
jgi:hypothetical protein